MPDNRDGAGILPDIRRRHRRAGRPNAAVGRPDSCIGSRSRRRSRPDQAVVGRNPRLDTRLNNNIIKRLKLNIRVKV